MHASIALLERKVPPTDGERWTEKRERESMKARESEGGEHGASHIVMPL